MDRQRSRLDPLFRAGIGNEPFGQLRAFAISDHPAHYVAAENIEDHVEIEVCPSLRAEQFRDVPAPELGGTGGQQFGLRVSRMDHLVAPLTYLALAIENPVHRANRAMITALIQKRGINRGRRAVVKSLLMETRQHRVSFRRNKRPRNKTPKPLREEGSKRKVKAYKSRSHPDHWRKITDGHSHDSSGSAIGRP